MQDIAEVISMQTIAITASPINLLRITPPVLGSFRFRSIQALHDVADRGRFDGLCVLVHGSQFSTNRFVLRA